MSAHALRVAVQVDEPRRDHAARGMEDDAAAQAGADGGDGSTLEGEVARGVEVLTGVDHAPAADHHGVLAGCPSIALGHCQRARLLRARDPIQRPRDGRLRSDGCQKF